MREFSKRRNPEQDEIIYDVPDLEDGEPEPPRPEHAPSDLKIRWEAPMPIVSSRADLGIHLPDETHVRGGERKHRLVTIGDSITQGFKSLAITDTSLSWPAMVAHELGLAEGEFTFPSFPGPAEAPGLPLNMEALIRLVDKSVGGRSLRMEEIRAGKTIVNIAKSVATYWEKSQDSAPPRAKSFHHNLAITGYDVRDSLDKTTAQLRDKMPPKAPNAGLVQRVVRDILRHVKDDFVTSYVEERIALRTLAGPSDASQVSAAKWFGDNGGIETLIVALGANNALGVVLSLQLHWSKEPEYKDLAAKRQFNLWAPSHFENEYAVLVDRLREIDAKHVILATVPHVTVIPIARGVGDKPYYSRYFSRYTRPWINDREFDPSVHPCLTGDEARAVDAAIDQYNYCIKRFVREARQGREGADDARDWYLLDLCGVLDRLAYRRYLQSPDSQPGWFKPYDLPPAMRALSPRPDTRFFQSDIKGRTQGGLIALDGVHPTTTGYTIIAQEVIDVMSLARVAFRDSDGNQRKDNIALDLDRWLQQDSLIQDPPGLLNEVSAGLSAINNVVNIAELLIGKGPS